MSMPLQLPFALPTRTPRQRLGGRAAKTGGYTMRKSQLGTRSRFGSPRATPRTLNPWGKAVAKTSVGKTTGTGQGSRGGRKPAGTSRARAHPDVSLKGMRYKANDPMAWPVEVPTSRSDLLLMSAMTAAKVTFNNNTTNKAYQRGGYAG